ncbi:hypothetical protein [Aureimonas glaciei]|uniref:Uncharacterized protein n=1 Tax=Aureimonas glaciei TaxID=1776957 RepID=A0A916XZP5_9HYPH|nr:hypothetical protein [Aureimonas glaciei]GGD24577.1 hypothetical protein GCM10011335_29380 [Aureimonas glaciei]
MSSTIELEADKSWPIRGPVDITRGEVARDKAPALHAVATRETAAEPKSEEPRRDWAAALTLVEEASQAIRMSDERVAELERLLQTQSLQMREDLLMIQNQLQKAQREVAAAHQQAAAAEARARESEEWLMRLNDAITDGFGSLPRRD